MGGVAAMRYRAESRFTTDLDVLVEWHDQLQSELESRGYRVHVLRDPGEQPHQFLVRRGPEKIDLVFSVVPYQDEALRRSVDHGLAVEDVIIHKLIAWRLRDRGDVRSILEAEHHLDEAYIERWASEWEVMDRWEEAKSELA